MMSPKFLYFSCSALLVLAFYSQAAPQETFSSESFLKTIQSVANAVKEKFEVPEELAKDKLYAALKDVGQKFNDKVTELSKKFDKDTKTYSVDFQQRFDALNKQFVDLTKAVGNKEFYGKSEKFYDTFEVQSKDISAKTAELLKSYDVGEPYQTYFKQLSSTNEQILAKVQEKAAELSKQIKT